MQGGLRLSGIPQPGGNHILCCMVPVDGFCTGDGAQDTPKANLGTGGVGFIGHYRPWKIGIPKEGNYKCLFNSSLFFSA